jgi:hypothetical protein
MLPRVPSRGSRTRSGNSRVASCEDLVTVGTVTPSIATSSLHVTDVACRLTTAPAKRALEHQTGTVPFVHVIRDGLKSKSKRL